MSRDPDYRRRYGDWGMVVGASEGLGEALTRNLAQRGMNLAMVARNPDKLSAAAKRVAADNNIETVAIAADLGEPDALDRIVAGLGGREIGFFIYNCAAENGGEFLEQDLESHLGNIQVNCIAPTILVHYFGRKMVARGRGGIVLCSSLAGLQGVYAWTSYGASKAYEMILGEGLWYELKHHGVDAATLVLGQTYTPNFQRSQQERDAPFARSRDPEDLPASVRRPQHPEDAAATLFAQIDREWIPHIYANAEDKAMIKAAANLSKTERILQMGDAMRATYKRAVAR